MLKPIKAIVIPKKMAAIKCTNKGRAEVRINPYKTAAAERNRIVLNTMRLLACREMFFSVKYVSTLVFNVGRKADFSALVNFNALFIVLDFVNKVPEACKGFNFS